MALTGKKKLFADAVLIGKSNREAAIAAGYSVKTASAAGSRLVKDKEVAKYLESRRKVADSPKVEAKAEPGVEPPAVDHSPPAPAAGQLDLGLLNKFYVDPKDFLMAAMNDFELEPKHRIDCAKSLMPFKHKKLGEGGKKEETEEAAKKAAGRFSPGAPPKLVAAGGKKV
jgi:phage terminase small subunit